jgi:phosphohistidine phosphatase
MELLVVRHAIAEDREAYAATGRDDAQRPLTARGARKMRRAAKGLRELVPTIDVLVTSPLTRANETAEIIRRAYKLDGLETAPVLQPSGPLDDVVAWLSRFESGVAAIVGHEPQLGRLVTCLLTGSDQSAVELKKGGACLIEFEERPGGGKGRLIWSLPPRTLRDLAG